MRRARRDTSSPEEARDRRRQRDPVVALLLLVDATDAICDGFALTAATEKDTDARKKMFDRLSEVDGAPV